MAQPIIREEQPRSGLPLNSNVDNKMLTLEKIALYRKYGGDIDSWSRIGTQQEHAAMTDADWYRIGELIQMLALVKSGTASPEYAITIHAEARQAVESEDDLRELDSFA